METILVTGGAGFIGANFVRRALAEFGRQVAIVDKLTYAGSLLNLKAVEQSQGFRFILGDIADRPLIEQILREVRPSAVVNFAAETHVDRSIDGPRNFLETNVVGTFALLEALRVYREQLTPSERDRFRFLHVSTDEVYGSLPDDGRATERSPYAPRSPYAASKAAADHFVHAYYETYGLPVLITNCTNNYGYYQYPEKLIPLAIGRALAGQPIPIYGDGLNVRDWIFVEDHCEGLLAVLAGGRPGANYNIGGNCERTNLELIRTICGLLDDLAPCRDNPLPAMRKIDRYADLITFVPDRPGHDRRYALDCALIRDDLGWYPRTTLEEGLRATVSWYLTNQEWAEAVQRGRYAGERLGLAVRPGAAPRLLPAGGVES
jgi:dTDP-glucose 4,6-dehydratase